MIYVSSSCIKAEKIKDSVRTLAETGFRNIELSGGTNYYEGFDSDLLALKEKFNLNYQCHNYFPPPKRHFVINLASPNLDLYKKSLGFIRESLILSKRLGATRYGFHAGFFINPKSSELGKPLSKLVLGNKEKCIEQFCRGLRELKEEFPQIKLFVENNVFSAANFRTYEGNNPFMLTSYKDYEDLKKRIDFEFLLDVAHLKVSCRSLRLDFKKELKKLLEKTQYLHLSDNDGLSDSNNSFSENSELFKMVKPYCNSQKIITLEIYDGISVLKKSYDLLNESL